MPFGPLSLSSCAGASCPSHGPRSALVSDVLILEQQKELDLQQRTEQQLRLDHRNLQSRKRPDRETLSVLPEPARTEAPPAFCQRAGPANGVSEGRVI
jgi:hypothetical protein